MPACQQLARNKKNIVLPGLVHNVNDYLRAADQFVSASHAEGMPNAVLEALAASLPVILSDIPPHREILEYSSDVGCLFTPSNPSALGRCLNQAKLDLSTQRAARRLIEQHFRAQSMSDAYQKLYKSALSRA